MKAICPDLYGEIDFERFYRSKRVQQSYLSRALTELWSLTPGAVRRLFECASDALVDFYSRQWAFRARDAQIPPDKDWLIWLILGGRGSGKTRAGAEWVRARVKSGARRIALVGPSFNEAREVMIEGESGLLNIGPEDERPVYVSSRKRLEWPNGAIGQVFSSAQPEGLRGPQFDTAWADEFCAWDYAEATLANLRLGLRLASKAGTPKLAVTTTPKPTKAFRSLIKSSGLVAHRMTTAENRDNLAAGFVAHMHDTYGGTRLGRQELDGEILTDHAGVLWSRAMIERARTDEASRRDFHRADYRRLIIAIDPPASMGEHADACGIIVAAARHTVRGGASKVTILHDGTVQGRSPENWAGQVLTLFDFYSADYVVAEANQGGEMVKSVLRQSGAHMMVRLVHAAKSKIDRASPVAMAYEQNRVTHAAPFPELEDELCELGSDAGRGQSPDRADALVWAVTELILRPQRVPRIRLL